MVSLYHNSSMWLDTQDISSWDENSPNFTLDIVSYLLRTVHIYRSISLSISDYSYLSIDLSICSYLSHYFWLFISSYQSIPSSLFISIYVFHSFHIYIYIYIYISVATLAYFCYSCPPPPSVNFSSQPVVRGPKVSHHSCYCVILHCIAQIDKPTLHGVFFVNNQDSI